MAQKNTLRYVILGLLSKEPMSGYDIKKAFEGEIGDFWYSNHSQIYPELNRMEQDGLIIGEEEIVGSKLTKKKYSITDSGQHMFEEWLAESLSSLPPTRDEFAMKVYFMDSPNHSLLKTLFNEEIQRHEEKLEYLQSRWKIVFGGSDSKDRHFGHALILERAIRREKDQLEWLREAFDRVKA